MRRRDFIAGAAALAPVQGGKTAVKLGVDLFSLRSQGWTPFQFLDYCAQWKVQLVHFSEIRFLGGLEDNHLKKVREHAERVGVATEVGMRSICPSSKLFDASQGTAEEQIARMIQAARALGSPIVRAFLGSSADRTGALPIEGHIENTVRVLKAVRSRVMDAGLKIAVENHSGDMQARELRTLIEAAGQDFVGACVDSGNPVWALEDPHLTLEVLAPYAITSHVRDSAVWRTPEGVAVAWTRMGDGNVDIGAWVRKFAERCPGRALSLEVIVTGPRQFPYLDPKFWEGYRKTPAWEFARFLALAEKGTPRQAPPKVSKEEAAAREREDLETSLRWTQQLLASI